jgi:hypothetical protein
LIFILVLLVGAFVGYSMTDIRGAREVRAFFSPVVRLVRKEVAQQLPKLREKTRQVMDNAADMLAGAEPACPPGTRLVTSVPAHAPEAHSGSGEHGPTERVCVDEHLVSEMDYSKCAVCEQPKGSRAEEKDKEKDPKALRILHRRQGSDDRSDSMCDLEASGHLLRSPGSQAPHRRGAARAASDVDSGADGVDVRYARGGPRESGPLSLRPRPAGDTAVCAIQRARAEGTSRADGEESACRRCIGRRPSRQGCHRLSPHTQR